MLIPDSIERTVPVREQLKRELDADGMSLFETEGISHKKGQFSVFQRFLWQDDVPSDHNRVRLMVREAVDLAKYGIFEWLDFNVFFIVYTERCGQFLVYGLSEGIIEDVLDSKDCKELAAWLSQYAGKRQRMKPLVKPEYFTCLDHCLRENGVPYPGNFDGIIFSETNVPQVVLEFSRVKYDSLQKHRKNLLSDRMGQRLFTEDKNRWRIILELSQELSISNLIIWWQDGNSDKFMTGSVAHVDSKSGLEYR